MQSAQAAREKAKHDGVDLSKIPKNIDMTADSITENVHAMNANCAPLFLIHW